MNRKGALPLIVLIPLIIVGLILAYFVLKILVGAIVQVFLWLSVLVIISLLGVGIYYLIMFLRTKTGRK